MTKLTKKEFVEVYVQQAEALGFEGLTKKDAAALVKAYENSVESIVLAGQVEALPLGFATAKIVDVPEKSGVSKLGGVEKPWTSPAHKTVRFKLAAGLKNALKGN